MDFGGDLDEGGDSLEKTERRDAKAKDEVQFSTSLEEVWRKEKRGRCGTDLAGLVDLGDDSLKDVPQLLPGEGHVDNAVEVGGARHKKRAGQRTTHAGVRLSGFDALVSEGEGGQDISSRDRRTLDGRSDPSGVVDGKVLADTAGREGESVSEPAPHAVAGKNTHHLGSDGGSSEHH